ncbi:MAG: nuclear transport factor 2 family protein [Pseudorhodoplanes sp.]|nr:nuclear transport factor 2 family protein [Pseudorhodoplanes sp.]GIK81691.1 MAG: ketosteroid isomerase [Alphaproteobacteria bacterium]
MSERAMRGISRAFCDALASQDPGRLAPHLDDDVEWMVFGPIDLFPFFGQRHGKMAVLDMCREVSAVLHLVQCDRETALVSGESAAALVRLTAVDRRTGRTLSLRLAQFATFRDDRLVSLKAIFDSFDAVEQTLGHQIDLSAVA